MTKESQDRAIEIFTEELMNDFIGPEEGYQLALAHAEGLGYSVATLARKFNFWKQKGLPKPIQDLIRILDEAGYKLEILPKDQEL